MSTTKEINSTTQKFLDIHDIVNDLLILKDGSTGLIITVNAMNFGLLAEEEQDAIIYSYAGLLNSLNYPIQIVIKSQTKDVTSYLHLLDEELAIATSHTKKEWIKRYRAFVGNLIKERNVLDKKFYVVIPATALEMGLIPPSAVIPGVSQTDLSSVERSVILDKAKEILEPKRDHLMSQFNRIGLIARQLTTQEIIQLFYLSYNPEAAEGQQITDTNSYTTPLVRASVSKGGNMNDLPVNNGAQAPTTTPVTPNPEGVTTPTPDQTASSAPSVAAVPDQAQPQAQTTPAPMPDLTAPAEAPVSQVNFPVSTPMPVVPNQTVDPQAEINSAVEEVSSATSPMPAANPIPVSNPISAPVGGVANPAMTTPIPAPNAPATPVNPVESAS